MNHFQKNHSDVQILETKSLDHLGLIAAAIDDLGLIERIDSLIPLGEFSGAKLTMGQRLAGMIINGLGFVNSRLYMTPKFFEKKPVERLFGPGIKAEFFNDDSLGRCLDAIYEYGPTKILSEVAFSIGIEKGLLGKVIHTDTTTLSYYGDREEIEELAGCETKKSQSHEIEEDFCAKPMYGYAKNKRMDLRQMTLLMTMTGKAHLPIFAQALDGNASDKVTLEKANQRIQAFQKSLNKGLPDLLCVTDSAGYDAFLSKGENLLWLSRVPENHIEAKHYVAMDDKQLNWTNVDDENKITSKTIDYKGVRQRWVMVFSKAAFDRECRTLDKNIKKESVLMAQALENLGHHHFGCEKDARDDLRKLEKKMKFHKIIDVTVTHKMKHTKSGRPKEDAEKVVDYVCIQGVLVADEDKKNLAMAQKGRFVLASNQMDEKQLSDTEMLLEYKGQSKVESGFKFLKNDAFHLDKIFLKNDKRINSLMIVMVMCLMVYNYAQFFIREKLMKAGKTIPSQTNRSKSYNIVCGSTILRYI